MMSLENRGVFQFLKEVIFRRILTFLQLVGMVTCGINHIRFVTSPLPVVVVYYRKWGYFRGIRVRPSALRLDGGTGPESF